MNDGQSSAWLEIQPSTFRIEHLGEKGVMKKIWIAPFALLAIMLATHPASADGLFKVGEKAPSLCADGHHR
jgi:hypothetical protein